MRITFDAPPLREVSLGSVFLPRPDFLVPHFGAFWETVKVDFPKVAHAPLLRAVDEPLIFDEQAVLPRVWLISDDSATLIQLQQNRFHYNWRQLSDTSGDYVRFPAVQSRAVDLWDRFCAFVQRATRTEIQPRFFELSYSNIVTDEGNREAFQLAAATMRECAWRGGDRFLKAPKDVNTAYVFEAPGDAGDLTVQVLSGRDQSSNRAILKIDLTLRGKAGGSERLRDWSNDAHDFLVAAFKDMTTPAMHEKWKLRESGDAQ